MASVTVDTDEAAKLLGPRQSAEGVCYDYSITGGNARLGPSRDKAPGGREYVAGETGELKTRGRALWVYGLDDGVTVDVFVETPKPYPDDGGGSASLFDTLSHGQDSVSSPGTEEALNGGNDLRIPKEAVVSVEALAGNTGKVYVGASGVTTSNGFELQSGKAVSLDVTNVSTVEIDVESGNGGDGVSWIVEQQ